MKLRGTFAPAVAGRRTRRRRAKPPAARRPRRRRSVPATRAGRWNPGPDIGSGTRRLRPSCGRPDAPLSGRSAGGPEGGEQRRLPGGVAPEGSLEGAAPAVREGLGRVVEDQPGPAMVAADDLAPGPGPALVGLAAERPRRRVSGVVDDAGGRPEDRGDACSGRPEPKVEVLGVEEDPLVERAEG